ncbi:AI-2E family transporter [Cryomorpha ignava]|uniref:AI-2E family transporter n=1 Tax=Cryomorpha ignava TaxID=101383 RepID=A0A7K3WN89_9FLAO|nr:AI-2E family transporter [Cryomorpha ignava]NEN23117.1 AI-2E family transporter [Cryomorpha ignava]
MTELFLSSIHGMKDLNFDSLKKLTIFLIFATLLVYIMIVGQGIIVPLTIAFFIAFFLVPLSNLLERIHFPRVLAAIVSVLVAIIVLAGLLTLLGSQVQRFASDADQMVQKFSELKDKLPDVVMSNIDDLSVEKGIKFVQSHMGEIFTSLTGFLGSFSVVIIVPIYIVLILVYRDHLKEFLFRVFDRKKAKSSHDEGQGIRKLVPRIRRVVQKYLTGVFYVMCILFVLYSIALFSLGIKHAMLFAAIAASLNIIPFVGPFIGSALPILFAFITKDSLFYPVAVLGCFVVIQAVEGNFLTPKIVGNNVSLNPFITLVALIVGGSIWGVVGMILFIPLVAILKEIFGAIDGLEPYGYLLGDPGTEDSEPKFLTKIVNKIKSKVSE